MKHLVGIPSSFPFFNNSNVNNDQCFAYYDLLEDCIITASARMDPDLWFINHDLLGGLILTTTILMPISLVNASAFITNLLWSHAECQASKEDYIQKEMRYYNFSNI